MATSDPPVPAALDALLREELARFHANGLYCFWCFRDVNGLGGEPEPHEATCWRVRVEAALRAAGPRKCLTEQPVECPACGSIFDIYAPGAAIDPAPRDTPEPQ